jgi:DNA-directed RNA polymerase subunit RPC12/RpoP
MKYSIQFECMEKECNTVVLGTHRQDGIRCPRCDGPVLPKPFQPIKKVSNDALYVRRMIIERCKKHCFDLTPEQVDTVIEIYKSKLTIGGNENVKDI